MPYKDADAKKAFHKRRSAEHYKANREKILERQKLRRLDARQKWNEYKSTLACSKCGEDHPATFDFHHVDKEDHQHVHQLISNGCFDAAIREIKKCIVLCANCHRKVHYEERKNPAF
jgi:DNA primase catalytic subunit